MKSSQEPTFLYNSFKSENVFTHTSQIVSSDSTSCLYVPHEVYFLVKDLLHRGLDGESRCIGADSAASLILIIIDVRYSVGSIHYKILRHLQAAVLDRSWMPLSPTNEQRRRRSVQHALALID